MAKIKILKTNQSVMARLGIYSHNLLEPTNEFFNSIDAYVILVNLLLTMIASVAFVYKNASEFQLALNSVLIIITIIQSFGAFLNTGLKMKKIKALHFKLQEIVDQVEDPTASLIYQTTEKKCQKLTKAMMAYTAFHELMFIGVFINSVYCIWVGNFDTSTWPLPFTMTVPFDATTIWGWYTLWLLQVGASVSYALSMTSTTSYFTCCCMYIESICDHFNVLINLIRVDVEHDECVKNPRKYVNNFRKIKEQMHQAVEIHVKLIEVSKLVADINGGTIFAVLPSNAILMGISMYGLEHSTLDLPPQLICYKLVCITCSLCWPYLFCHFATRTTERIATIGDAIYESNWYIFSPELQKYTILIIARSQITIKFSGFKLIGCSLEIFGKIFRSACSYYLIFRRFAQI